MQLLKTGLQLALFAIQLVKHRLVIFRSSMSFKNKRIILERNATDYQGKTVTERAKIQ